jgi:hypothetical protein
VVRDGDVGRAVAEDGDHWTIAEAATGVLGGEGD